MFNQRYMHVNFQPSFMLRSITAVLGHLGKQGNKIVCITTFNTLSTVYTQRSVVQRPSSQDPDVVSLLLMGRINGDKVVKNPKALVDEINAIIGRPDIKFGEVIWSSKYR